VLEAIVRDVPPPKGDASAPLKALIFDSWYDSYRGVIVLFRVIDGSIRPGMKIRLFNAGRDYQVETLGVNRPRPTPIDHLGVGEVGFLTASIKTVADVQIGDTITKLRGPRLNLSRLSGNQADGFCGPLPGGYQPVRRASRCDG
jgi:GTP-binding protein LepA